MLASIGAKHPLPSVGAGEGLEEEIPLCGVSGTNPQYLQAHPRAGDHSPVGQEQGARPLGEYDERQCVTVPAATCPRHTELDLSCCHTGTTCGKEQEAEQHLAPRQAPVSFLSCVRLSLKSCLQIVACLEK